MIGILSNSFVLVHSNFHITYRIFLNNVFHIGRYVIVKFVVLNIKLGVIWVQYWKLSNLIKSLHICFITSILECVYSSCA